MLRLPKKIGPFTLMRKLGADGVTESYAGILDEPAGKQVVVRKLAPFLLIDPVTRTTTESRIGDLKAIRHPTLVPILDLVSDGDDRYVLEEWVDAVDLRTVIDHCVENHRDLPANVYLNLATQVCNGIEALHGRPGSSSGAEHVLHLSIKPESVFVTNAGKLLVGNYGLTPTPTSLPKAGVSGATTMRMEYLSPEQTQPDQQPAPASDIFSLGSVLYELLTLEPLFRAESNLQTIHRVRRAEVTAQLLRVKELMPGLDKVLYRALSLNPRHRYQRAFVLREDLRGLMAGYSFSTITEETARFLAPLFEAAGRHPQASQDAEPGFDDTAAILRHSLAQGGKDPQSLGEAPEDTTAPLGTPPSAPTREPQDTGAFVAQARGGLSPANVTLAPPDEPSLAENTSGRDRTTWEQGGPNTTWDEGKPARPTGDSTTWFPAGGIGAGLDARPAAPPRPHEFDEERPTDVRAELTPEPAGIRSTPATPVNRAPSPPERPAAHAPPEAEIETTYDDEPARGGGNALLIWGGAAVAAVVALLVCGGVIGGGAIVGSQVGGTEEVAVAPAPTPEPVAAVPLPSPDPAEPQPPSVAPVPVAVAPSPAPSVTPVAVAPSPAPVSVAVAPRPSPAPTYVAPAPSPVAPRPTVAPAPRPASTASLVPVPSSGGESGLGMDLGDLSAYSDKAFRGGLSSAERSSLEEIDRSDPDYTRAQVLLYQDAKARDDLDDRAQYIGNVMALPENQYNPQFLTEQAEIAIRREDYDSALEKANLAERHWARLPSELIFSRKAMIYEIQASSYQGKFYNSGGEDTDSLYQAIKAWEKYQRHVQTRSREDLTVRAEDQLAKLYDMKRRLEQP